MFVMLAVVFTILVFTAMATAYIPIEGSYSDLQSKIIKTDMATIMVAIEQLRLEGGSSEYEPPENLVLREGYEYLRFSNPMKYQFAKSSGLRDSVWQYDRSALWFESASNFLGKDAYLNANNNLCGNLGFSDATSWCGNNASIWAKSESRSAFSEQLLSEKQRLYRTISKFYKRYNKDFTFSPLANGSAVTLASLAGYAGSAANCRHTFLYNEIPLSCEDLFNFWGHPVVLNKLSANHIVLVNRTGIVNSSGQYVRIAEEAKIE